MKKTDMELQAIREKLQMLKAEPPASETLALPWSAPQATAEWGTSEPTFVGRYPDEEIADTPASYTAISHPSEASQSPQAIAIETLRQRSTNPSTHPPDSTGDTTPGSRADNLVAQELYRLEVQAHNINARSQQQADEIMSLKRSAQQAAVALKRHGIHTHPQLEAITQFLEGYQSAVVPHIEKDDAGRFALTYDTIDFCRAQQEAISTAQALRARAMGSDTHAALFSQPIVNSTYASKGNPLSHQPLSHQIESDTASDVGNHSRTKTTSNREPNSQLAQTGIRRMSRALGHVGTQLSTQISGLRKRKPRRQAFSGINTDLNLTFKTSDDNAFSPTSKELVESDLESEEYFEGAHFGSGFSWLDGAIWFSVSAIARIGIEFGLIQYPFLSMPLLIGLVGTIAFVIYRIIVSKSADLTPAFRLLIVMLGLFSGGLFY